MTASHAVLVCRQRALGAGLGAVFCAALAAWPAYAAAQYKVVGSDGRVTYTDVPPPPAGQATVRALKDVAAPPEAAQVPLSLALRDAVARFPVVLYAGPGCAACDAARSALRQRGIPFTERQVVGDADIAALAQLSSGNQLPVATVGAQVLRGYSAAAWAGYLDAAGYPATSQLPAAYRYAPARPLTGRPAPDSDAAAQQAPAAAPVDAPPPPSDPSGIRF